MIPAFIIQGAIADGVNVLVMPTGKLKVTGTVEAVRHWTPVLRKHKSAIIAELKAAPWWSWLLRFADRDPVDVACGLRLAVADVLTHYPSTLTAEPVYGVAARAATSEEVAELQALIAVVLVAEADRVEALELALGEPHSGLVCWRALAAQCRDDGLISDHRRPGAEPWPRFTQIRGNHANR